MVVFGSPLPSSADVTNTVRAALDIQQSITR
jgi:hypothetical protein